MASSRDAMHSGLLNGSTHQRMPPKLPWCIAGLSAAASVWLIATREATPFANPWMRKEIPAPEDLASLQGPSSAESLLAGEPIINIYTGDGGQVLGPVSPSPPPPLSPWLLPSYNFMQLNGFGPSAPTSTAAYDGSLLAGQVVLNHGVQEWVVPRSGIYWISAAGASTYRNEIMPYKGRGAAVSGVFNLTVGTDLKILVGQMGLVHANNDGAAGGGGASWVWIADADEPLLVGGGAGGSREQVGSNPVQYISGSVDGNTRTHCLNGRMLGNPFDEHCTSNRQGGHSRAAHCDGGGGGGWSRNGANGGESAEGGHAIKGSSTPGAGGNSGGCGGHDAGGFGGGGAGGFDAGGGGGGYIAGDGGQYSAPYTPGTGGSSYVNQASLSSTVGDFWNDADGFVRVEFKG